MSQPPDNPKIYHIVHEDCLPLIIKAGSLWCDEAVTQGKEGGTKIGIDDIKQRRLTAPLKNHPGLRVGQCVPFYFCPRSVMLNTIHNKSSDLAYKGGQEPVVHLEAQLREVVTWADLSSQKWAFTTSNAGGNDFEDYNDLSQLDQIDWEAVRAKWWARKTERNSKQAEFLLEYALPWEWVSHIGVQTQETYNKVMAHLQAYDA